MTDCRSERGTTLVEALVAGALLVTIAAGVAWLVLLARRLAVEAERSIVATTLAVSRLQDLRAVPFEYRADGSPGESPALALSPADALDRDLAGCSEVLDESGQPTTLPAPGGAAFIRRWAVQDAAATRPDTRAIEVCVFAWPAPAGAPPLACVATVRTRQS